MFVLKKGFRSGFTLIEIVFTMTLVVILAGLSLTALRPAASKAPTQGMARTLVEEFTAARQLAISSGRPVALGIPRDTNAPVASSIYRLEGWNKPTITWSKGFSGDYPKVGFAAARWSGGSWTNGATPSAVSKIGAFDILQWLPDNLEDDYIFCYTPDGGLVTNDMPALDDRYVVVVGENLSGSAGNNGFSLTSVSEPITLMISPYGGVEMLTGTPGASLPTGTGSSKTSSPVVRTQYAPGQVRLSNIRITPKLEGSDDEGVCVPGQFVTLEVYAYDPEGRGLFAKWKQPNKRGVFTVPDGGAATGSVLESEVDRMEFVKEAPDDVTWTGVAPPPGGLFRARWSWTVPLDSEVGDVYDIEVDVKDVKGEIAIVNPPPKITLKPAPKGRIIAEKYIGGRWQLVQLNPDGSNLTLLSPPNVTETMASLDDSGTKMAFLQGDGTQKFIKVRMLDSGKEFKVAGPGNFVSVSISPNGTWLSYPTPPYPGGNLVTVRVDGSGSFNLPQTLSNPATPPPRARSGWSQDSEYLFYESGTNIMYRNMLTGASGTLVGPIKSGPYEGGAYWPESLYCPITYRANGLPTGQERVLFSLGNNNPVLMSVQLNRLPGGHAEHQASDVTYSEFSAGATNRWVYLNGPGEVGSEGIDDCFPTVSKDSKFLILNRLDQGALISETGPQDGGQKLAFVPLDTSTGNYVGTSTGPQVQLADGTLRRAIWIP